MGKSENTTKIKTGEKTASWEFSPLTEEELKDIDEKVEFTPEEILKEWEDMGFCPYTEKTQQCEAYQNDCDACARDYVLGKGKYIPIDNSVSGINLKGGSSILQQFEIQPKESSPQKVKCMNVKK